jgi:hypothetical protein
MAHSHADTIRVTRSLQASWPFGSDDLYHDTFTALMTEAEVAFYKYRGRVLDEEEMLSV